jgi:hypothetical protein
MREPERQVQRAPPLHKSHSSVTPLRGAQPAPSISAHLHAASTIPEGLQVGSCPQHGDVTLKSVQAFTEGALNGQTNRRSGECGVLNPEVS